MPQYYSPYSQWPSGFLICFKDYMIQQIRFSTFSLAPEYSPIEAIHFTNYVDMTVNFQGGKQSDDARPISTTIIS